MTCVHISAGSAGHSAKPGNEIGRYILHGVGVGECCASLMAVSGNAKSSFYKGGGNKLLGTLVIYHSWEVTAKRMINLPHFPVIEGGGKNH